MKDENKRRWKVLANAIRKKQVLNNSTLTNLCEKNSVIQKSSDAENTFQIDLEKLTQTQDLDFNNNSKLSVPKDVIRLSIYPPNIKYDREILTGFNNTGNVKIWPAEEVLTRFMFNFFPELLDLSGNQPNNDCKIKQTLYSNKIDKNSINFLELGGGYSSMASLFFAKFIKNRQFSLQKDISFHVTDGNQTSINHCQKLINTNNLQNLVSAKLLRWDDTNTFIDTNFDYLLIADCFFFDEFREPLKDTVVHYFMKNRRLKVICVAPSRNDTFQKFLGLFDESKTDQISYTKPVFWPENSDILLSILYIY